MSKFDMCAEKVTIDLPAVLQVLEVATATLHDALQVQLAAINDDLRSAAVAAQKGRTGHNYLDLCHANTKRIFLVRLAQQLADAIEAQFHVNEACTRQTVIVDRSGDTSADTQ